MKNQLKTILVIIILFPFWLHSQTQEGVGLNAGYTDGGFGALAGYSIYPDRYQFFEISAYFGFSKDKFKGNEIPYSVYSVNVGYYNRVFNSRARNFNLFVGGGPLLGYEIVNNGDKFLDNGAIIEAESKFLYGGYIGLEGELIITYDFSLTVKAMEFWHPSSDLGKFTPFISLGFRYIIF